MRRELAHFDPVRQACFYLIPSIDSRRSFPDIWRLWVFFVSVIIRGTDISRKSAAEALLTDDPMQDSSAQTPIRARALF